MLYRFDKLLSYQNSKNKRDNLDWLLRNVLSLGLLIVRHAQNVHLYFKYRYMDSLLQKLIKFKGFKQLGTPKIEFFTKTEVISNFYK